VSPSQKSCLLLLLYASVVADFGGNCRGRKLKGQRRRACVVQRFAGVSSQWEDPSVTGMGLEWRRVRNNMSCLEGKRASLPTIEYLCERWRIPLSRKPRDGDSEELGNFFYRMASRSPRSRCCSLHCR